MRQHKPYGDYGRYTLELPRISKNLDVVEAHDALAQGYRIRNKKALRRAHNKTSRQQAKFNINEAMQLCQES